jgi:tripeptide aminopeptidase
LATTGCATLNNCTLTEEVNVEQREANTMNRQRLLERFLRYVVIDTTANEHAETYPSSPGQFVLGKVLLDELHAMGLKNSVQDEHGLVWATIPANVAHAAPVVAFNSHLDTSPETTGRNVRPQVIQSYSGGDLVLPGDSSKVIRADDHPELAALIGNTIITTDGTTLLGGDDKAGLAIIMEMAQTLVEEPTREHGEIRLLFTCDEEIGQGVAKVDLKKLAANVCYTLDGGGANEVDVETFSADLAVILIRGVNIHPSIGKNRMVNALRAAGEFLSRLPRELAPETTEGRQGFIHPYSMEGGVAEVKLRIILRDFETSQLRDQADTLRVIAAEVEQIYPGVSFALQFTQQYRNLAEGLRAEPRAVALAQQAHENLGRKAKLSIIRGGTDGSQLTALGLPTPNLSSGQHNPHSPLEWACLDEMQLACEMIIELTRLWGAEHI